LGYRVRKTKTKTIKKKKSTYAVEIHVLSVELCGPCMGTPSMEKGMQVAGECTDFLGHPQASFMVGFVGRPLSEVHKMVSIPVVGC
jgi:predicted metal-binding protein